MRRIAASFVVICAIGCNANHDKHHGKKDRSRPPQVVRAIERELGRQLGVPVTARCASILGLPSSCVAILPDHREIPIRATWSGGQWELATRTPLITTAPIVTYVQSELADLGITDPVRCDPAIRPAPAPGDPITCTFGSGGGVAFVQIDDTGAIGDVQLALDHAAAEARATPGDLDLEQQSRALAHLADDEDDDSADTDADDATGSAHGSAEHEKHPKHRHR